jgi:hypothetical protein
MATIEMSTNSASTSNNGGTGNKQLRGSLVTLQNDIDLADAILQNGGTALAANDIIEAIAVPANTMILYAGFKVVTAMTGTTTDSAIHVGITGTDVDLFAASFDLDGASVGDITPPAGLSSGVVANGTITGGIIRVFAVCVLMDEVSQSGSANEVDRDLLA